MSHRRGFIATLVAAERRAERDAVRRHRHHLAQLRQLEAMNQRAHASSTVEMYETQVEVIATLHHDAAHLWDWGQVAASPPPPPQSKHETDAQTQLESYRPTFFERLFGQAEKRRALLQAAVNRARVQDETATREMLEHWNWYQQVARGVLQGDLRAYQTVIDHLGPFEELESVGAGVKARIVDCSFADAVVTIRDDAVPAVEQKLLASGKLSSKEMAKGKYWGLYQSHVCSAGIRVARELFHLLPIDRVYVHVGAVRLSTATGHTGRETLLSVEFDRNRLLGLNFERIEPADAVEPFRHAMSFKKTTGFTPVEPLEHLAQLTSLEMTPTRRR